MINVDDRLIDEVLPSCGVDSFAVIMVITRHINKDKKTFVGIKKIREKTKLSRERAYKAIAKLIDGGYLERWQENEKGNFGNVFYRISTPYLKIFVSAEGYQLQEQEEPLYGKPYNGNAYNGNPDYGNPSNISITNKGSINKKVSIKSLSSKEENKPLKNQRKKSTPSTLTQPAIDCFLDWYKSQTGETFVILPKDAGAIKKLVSMIKTKYKESLSKPNAKTYETDQEFIDHVFKKFLDEYAKLETYYSSNKTPTNLVSRFNEVYVDIKSKNPKKISESESKQLQKLNDLLDIIEFKIPDLYEQAEKMKRAGKPHLEIIQFIQNNQAQSLAA